MFLIYIIIYESQVLMLNTSVLQANEINTVSFIIKTKLKKNFQNLFPFSGCIHIANK